VITCDPLEESVTLHHGEASALPRVDHVWATALSTPTPSSSCLPPLVVVIIRYPAITHSHGKRTWRRNFRKSLT
jgi:hypothetical protein